MAVAAPAVSSSGARPPAKATEIISGRHTTRPAGGGNLHAAEALPGAPPPAPAREGGMSGGEGLRAAGGVRGALPPAVAGEGGYPPGAATRIGEMLYDFRAKRIVHRMIAETPVRASSLRGLGAPLNVFAIEGLVDELA